MARREPREAPSRGNNVVDFAAYLKRKMRKPPPEPTASGDPAQEETQAEAQEHNPAELRRRNGIIITIVVGVVLAISILLVLEVYATDTIEVNGVSDSQASRIVEMSGVKPGRLIFFINPQRVYENLLNQADFYPVSVDKRHPDVLQIDVAARVPYAVFSSGGVYVLVDTLGIVMEGSTEPISANAPLVSGVAFGEYAPGYPFLPEESRAYKNFHATAQALIEADAMHYVQEINVEDIYRVNLRTGEGVVAELGKAEGLERKAQAFADAMHEVKVRGYTSGTLYVTENQGAVFSPSGGDAQQP